MKAKVFDSMKAAAASLGLNMRVLKRAKASGCQAFRGGRVYADELQQWVRENAELVRAANSGGGDLKEQKTTEEVRKLRLANDLKEGRLIERARVAEMIRRAGGELATFRARSEAEHPTRIPDGDMAAKRVVVQEIWDEIYNMMGRLSVNFKETPKRARGAAK